MYNKHFPNFGKKSTQQSESSPLLIIGYTNKKTSIETTSPKLKYLLEGMAKNHRYVIGQLNRNFLQLVNDKPDFKKIIKYVKNNALYFLFHD